MGRRVMATYEPPKLEERVRFLRGPPAHEGAIFQEAESCTRTAGIRVRIPVAPPTFSPHGVVAQRGERFDGIEEVTGAIPVDSTKGLRAERHAGTQWLERGLPNRLRGVRFPLSAPRADSRGEDRRLQNGKRGFDSLSALEEREEEEEEEGCRD